MKLSLFFILVLCVVKYLKDYFVYYIYFIIEMINMIIYLIELFLEIILEYIDLLVRWGDIWI